MTRALLRKRKILLLDEASSSLDAESDRNLQSALRSGFKRDCTIIIIAHRLSTIMDVDRVFVMADGEIVEEGSPDELIGRGGQFAALAVAQGLA